MDPGAPVSERHHLEVRDRPHRPGHHLTKRLVDHLTQRNPKLRRALLGLLHQLVIQHDRGPHTGEHRYAHIDEQTRARYWSAVKHPRATRPAQKRESPRLRGLPVDLTGIEPVTS